MTGDENDRNAANSECPHWSTEDEEGEEEDLEANPVFNIRSPEERKNIRRSYRQLLNSSAQLDEEGLKEAGSKKKVGKIIKKSNKLHGQIDK